MILICKKAVLTVTMLGCAFGAQAADEKKTTSLSSTTKNALAMAGVVAGGLLMNEGQLWQDYDHIPVIDSKSVLIAGTVVATTGGLYLLSKAQGVKAKIKSLCGSLNLLIGSIPAFFLLMVCGGHSHSPFKYTREEILILLGICATTALPLATGYFLQPEEKAQNDEAIVENVNVENNQ